ncbi:pentatricopeptide repeat-containing protein [Quercus suber]|uniref:Pentatricopeptide repeat-containing protein n=1 Tax=Quercus suber TaxID=58331 RepID=A0AAW0JDM4_QUESU|nr:pentatricopeptide repeat-containing protein [Quercus suber]
MCVRGSALSLYLVQLLSPVDEKFHTHLRRNGAKNIEKTLATVNATLDSNCVIEVLHQPNQSQMGLRFFIWAGLQSKYRHSSFMYSKACELLQINQNLGVVDIVEVYRVDGYVVSAKAFKVVLNLCEEARLANEALWILGKMNEFGLEADTTAYNVVIRLFCEKGDMDMAEELMKRWVLVIFILI